MAFHLALEGISLHYPLGTNSAEERKERSLITGNAKTAGKAKISDYQTASSNVGHEITHAVPQPSLQFVHVTSSKYYVDNASRTIVRSHAKKHAYRIRRGRNVTRHPDSSREAREENSSYPHASLAPPSLCTIWSSGYQNLYTRVEPYMHRLLLHCEFPSVYIYCPMTGHSCNLLHQLLSGHRIFLLLCNVCL